MDAKRINVFVGEPNTGKSNILEALDLSFLSEMLDSNRQIIKANKNKIYPSKINLIDIKQFFRVDKAEKLFRYGNIDQPIVVNSSSARLAQIEYKNNEKGVFNWTAVGSTYFDNDFKPIDNKQTFYGSPIIPFLYRNNLQSHDIGNYINKLMPLFGNNLGKVISLNYDMQKLLKDFASEHSFEFNINSTTNEISIQLRINEGLVFTLPFEALADTFKRMLFYIATVKHNNASVITLDEPDTHAFPNYVSLLADEIIDQKNNQFFITTHNPYLLSQLIEQTPKGELAVFVCGFNKSEKSTFARKLTDEDLSELLDYGVDIFFNLNRYLNDGIEYST